MPDNIVSQNDTSSTATSASTDADTICNPKQLLREASALHWSAFGREVTEEVAQHYAHGHEIGLLRVDTAQVQWMESVLREGIDLEALECSIRKRNPNHILCQKLKLLIYITEAFPQYYIDFVNEEPCRLSAWWELALSGIRTFYKHLKARWLLGSWN